MTAYKYELNLLPWQTHFFSLRYPFHEFAWMVICGYAKMFNLGSFTILNRTEYATTVKKWEVLMPFFNKAMLEVIAHLKVSLDQLGFGFTRLHEQG